MDERNYKQNLKSAYELAEIHYQEKLEKQKEKELQQKLKEAEKLQKRINKHAPFEKVEIHD